MPGPKETLDTLEFPVAEYRGPAPGSVRTIRSSDAEIDRRAPSEWAAADAKRARDEFLGQKSKPKRKPTTPLQRRMQSGGA